MLLLLLLLLLLVVVSGAADIADVAFVPHTQCHDDSDTQLQIYLTGFSLKIKLWSCICD